MTVVFSSDAGARSYYDEQFAQIIQWDVDLLSGYKYAFLPVRFHGRVAQIFRMARQADVAIIHGHSQFVMLLAAALCRLLRTPYLLRGDSLPTSTKRGVLALIRDARAGLVVSAAAGGIASGSRNEQFYRRFRAREITLAPFSVDSSRFVDPELRTEDRRSQGLRALGLTESAPTLIFAGKLIAKKRPADLLAAAKRLNRPANVLFVGDGPLRCDLERQAEGLTCRFVGFVNQADMPRVLALGDVLVVPSDVEPWGLVVNEGLAAGLMPVVSDQVGCSPDLVVGVGKVFPVGDDAALACALEAALNELRGDEWRDLAKRRLQHHSLDATASGFEEAVLKTVQNMRAPRLGVRFRRRRETRQRGPVE